MRVPAIIFEGCADAAGVAEPLPTVEGTLTRLPRHLHSIARPSFVANLQGWLMDQLVACPWEQQRPVLQRQSDLLQHASVCTMSRLKGSAAAALSSWLELKAPCVAPYASKPHGTASTPGIPERVAICMLARVATFERHSPAWAHAPNQQAAWVRPTCQSCFQPWALGCSALLGAPVHCLKRLPGLGASPCTTGHAAVRGQLPTPAAAVMLRLLMS